MDTILKELNAIQHRKQIIDNLIKVPTKISICDNVKIDFREFKPTDPETDIRLPQFYQKYTGTYYLTNGANKYMAAGGGGSNAAITSLSTDFFALHNAKLIYNSKNSNIDPKVIGHRAEMFTIAKSPYNGLYAGSVLYIDTATPVKINKSYIKGVYHVNGFDWRENTTGVDWEKVINRNDFIPLITSYYGAIVSDFLSKSNPTKLSVLHLAKIPGHIFGGKDETFSGMISALSNHMDAINKSNVRIIVDMSDLKKCYNLL